MSQACASCSATNIDGAKFCNECGSPLARTCPGCGASGVSGKFCHECGTPLSGAAPAAHPAPVVAAGGPVSERRTTSVLFGDLVSFTTISEARDPEEVRELLSAYFAVARTVVGRYGGTIEKFIGDAVMAVWGVPVAHEDDAERAVRAGLDLVAEVTALGDSVGVPDLAMRVGIVTGSVAVTLGATNEGMVAGDAVNTAARVQTAAAPTTVWVDAETRGLTAAAVAYTDMGEHAMKGKAEPARLFRADAIVAARGGAQRVDGLEAPMAGRDAELRQVRELFHATEDDGRARIALVTGVAGVGKSRLGWEFEKYVDGLTTVARWHRGRCLSYGDGVAFWAFAEMVRSRLKVLETDDRGEVDAKVRAGVSSVAADAAEAAWLTPRVHALLAGGDRTTFDRTDLFAAWTTYLERVAESHPLVLLFEDVQHADAELLDLVEHLLETSRAKLYVLLLTRPELLEQRPSLAGGRRATVVDLQPLGAPAMTTLVDALVAELPVKARTAIVGRAEGVPLYAVETVRSLIDRDAVQARDGRYVFVDDDGSKVDLDQLAAPTSLQTLIAARLDALTPVERRTVQDASVLGLSFRQAGLLALSDVSGWDLDQALDALVRKGVLETQSDPRSPELGSYRFLQALVREVAYSTLARKDRKSRHLAAADHLGSEAEGSSDVLAGVIAQHLLDALEASTDRDADKPEIAARARALLAASATRAQALGSSREALRAVLAALALDPDPLETAQLETAGARAARMAGEPGTAAELAARAAVTFQSLDRPADLLRALAEQARALQVSGRTQEALRVAEAALSGALDGAGQDTLLELTTAAGMCYRALGMSREQHRSGLEGLRLAEQVDDPILLVRALNNLGIALVDLGAVKTQVRLLEWCIELSREQHQLPSLARSLSNLLSALYPRDLGRTSSVVAEAVSTARQVGDSQLQEVTLFNAGTTWWLAGEWDPLLTEVDAWFADHEPGVMAGGQLTLAAAVHLARGEAAPRVSVPPSEDPWDSCFAGLASALQLASTGDVLGGARAAAAVAAAAWASGEALEDFEGVWAMAVDLQLMADDLDAAQELLTFAAPFAVKPPPVLRGQVPRLRGTIAARRGQDPDADLRLAERELAAFGSPYYLALTRLELGRWLLGEGRGGEAELLLGQARDAFAQLKAEPSLAELDALQPVVV